MARFLDRLRLHASVTPDTPAILAPGRPPLKFAGLLAQAEELAGRLEVSGLSRDGVVASVLPDAAQTLCALFGSIGVTGFAPLNPNLREAEYKEALEDLRPTALLVPADETSCARGAASAAGIPVFEARPTPEAGAGLFRFVGREVARAASPGAAAPRAAALLLQTSATTGRAKIVPLTHENLAAMADATIRSVMPGPADRFLSMMPLFHLQGLLSATAQLIEGGSVVCAAPFNAERFPGWMEEFRPTWYTAGPALHRTILALLREKPDILRSSRLRLVRSIGSALPAELLRELEETLHVPVVEGYGLTEAGAVTSTPVTPYRSKAGSAGTRLTAGVEIMDEAGRLLPVGRPGEIVLRGSNVMHGYHNDPEASRAAFRYGWFRTGDLGCFDEEGYLHVTGRIKEIVNRGGEKVIPEEVDRVLLSHPSVEDAAAFGIPHPQLGDDLAVAVVVREGAALDALALRAFAAQRLADFKVPRVVRFVGRIPRGATGKAQRSRLAEEFVQLQEAEAAARAGTAPATEDERKLAAIWATVLGIQVPGVEEDFFELGGHSLASTRVLTRIEETFGIQLRHDALLVAPTVRCLAALLREPGALRGRIVSIQPLGSKPAFFMVRPLPIFRPLARLLGSDRPFLGVALPLVVESQGAADVPGVARQLVSAIRQRQPKGPYYLGGWCADGVLAFEIAQQLFAKGETVGLLALFDTPHPARLRRRASRASIHWRFRMAGWRIRFQLASLRQLGWHEMPEYALERAAALMRAVADLSRMSAGRKAAAAVMRGSEHHPSGIRLRIRGYEPAPYAGRVALFRVAGKPGLGPAYGWDACSRAGFAVYTLPGDHLSMFLRPHVEVLAAKLAAELDRSENASTGRATLEARQE